MVDESELIILSANAQFHVNFVKKFNPPAYQTKKITGVEM